MIKAKHAADLAMAIENVLAGQQNCQRDVGGHLFTLSHKTAPGHGAKKFFHLTVESKNHVLNLRCDDGSVEVAIDGEPYEDDINADDLAALEEKLNLWGARLFMRTYDAPDRRSLSRALRGF